MSCPSPLYPNKLSFEIAIALKSENVPTTLAPYALTRHLQYTGRTTYRQFYQAYTMIFDEAHISR